MEYLYETHFQDTRHDPPRLGNAYRLRQYIPQTSPKTEPSHTTNSIPAVHSLDRSTGRYNPSYSCNTQVSSGHQKPYPLYGIALSVLVATDHESGNSCASWRWLGGQIRGECTYNTTRNKTITPLIHPTDFHLPIPTSFGPKQTIPSSQKEPSRQTDFSTLLNGFWKMCYFLTKTCVGGARHKDRRGSGGGVNLVLGTDVGLGTLHLQITFPNPRQTRSNRASCAPIASQLQDQEVFAGVPCLSQNHPEQHQCMKPLRYLAFKA